MIIVSNTSKKRMDREFSWKMTIQARGLPLRTEAIHLCMDSISSPYKLVFDMVSFVFNPFLKMRIKAQFGSYQQCVAELQQTYGIPAQNFPLKLEQDMYGKPKLIIQTEHHIEMFTQLRAVEQQTRAIAELLSQIQQQPSSSSFPQPSQIPFTIPPLQSDNSAASTNQNKDEGTIFANKTVRVLLLVIHYIILRRRRQ